MGYGYAQRVAWIDDLPAEREPHVYDLCEHHTARQSVPFGWVLEDRRRRHAATADRLAG